MGYEFPEQETVKDRLDRELGQKSTPAERATKRFHECYAAVARVVRSARATAWSEARKGTIGRDLLQFLGNRCAYAEEQRSGLQRYLRERREARASI